MGLTDGVAGGKTPELYYELHTSSNDKVMAEIYGHSSPVLFFNSELLLADEQNDFSSAFLAKKDDLPAELVIEVSSPEKKVEFKENLKEGFNSFNFAIPPGQMKPGKYITSVYLKNREGNKYEKISGINFIDSSSILQQADMAQKQYETLCGKVEKIQAKSGKDPYLVSALGLAEYFIPFVRQEATRKSIYRAIQMNTARENIPVDSAYKSFMYKRASRNIAYINKMLMDNIDKADRILEEKEQPLNIPEMPQGVKTEIVKGSLTINGKPTFFLGPNTWTTHYTQIAGIARCGFNLIDFHRLGEKIVCKDEPFYIPRYGFLLLNGNSIVEAEKNNVFFFGREWVGDVRLNEALLAKVEPRLKNVDEPARQLDLHPNLVYWITQSERFHREKEIALEEKAFRAYLQKKYGSIAKLNVAMGTDFNAFDEINDTNTNVTGSLKYEFFLFESDYQIDILKRFNAAKRKYLKSPLCTHYSTRNLNAYDQLMGAADYERLWEYFEIIGWDGGSHPDDPHYAMDWSNNEILHCDLAKSFYPDKPIANNELHIIPGKYASEVSSEYIYAAVFLPFLLGRNAAVIWHWDIDQHNPWGNHLFTRANAHHAAARAALDSRRLADYITPFQRMSSPVAILYSLPSMADSSYFKDMTSVYEGLFFTGFPVRFISEKQVAEGKLNQYKILVVSDARRVKEETFTKIVGFAAEDGKVLLVGDKSLNCDEYGKNVPPRLKAKAALITTMKISSPKNYFYEFGKIIDNLKLSPEVEVRGLNGKRVWALAYRSVKIQDGTRLLYAINLGKNPCKAKVMVEGKLFDLIRNRHIDNTIEFKPLEIYFLKY